MELMRKIRFQNRINIMINGLMGSEWEIIENLNEQKELSDLGIESQVYKYQAKLSILRSRMSRLEELETRGPSERFLRRPVNNVPFDIPANWINMSLTEMLWWRVRNGGIKQGIERMSMSGYLYGSEIGATVSMIFLALTFPLWVWFPLYKERKKWRTMVADGEIRFRFEKNN